MEWPNDVIFSFLRLYEAEPTLWNTNSAEHKNQKDLYDAWYRIKRKLGNGNIPIKEIKKKRDHLMATYRKLRSKLIIAMTLGRSARQIFKPDWPFYRVMSGFLDDVYKPRKNRTKNTLGDQEATSSHHRRKKNLEKNKEGIEALAEAVRPEEEDDCAAFCTNLKVQMRDLKTVQKYICQKLISDAIFLARTSQLNLSSRITTEILQTSLLKESDCVSGTSSSTFQIELVPDSSSFNKRSHIPSEDQRNISLRSPEEGYFCVDPLHQDYEELDEGHHDIDRDGDIKQGLSVVL